MYTQIENYCSELATHFDEISSERKLTLEKISNYILAKKNINKQINLVYICTHNSRRSHFGQVWAKVSSVYYDVREVNSFSGGTEATAFNGNAINALKRVGFKIVETSPGRNPLFEVNFSDNERPIECFSKVFDDPKNPESEFAAIMTCSDAEQNCPFIAGAELRIATTYEDPKAFDDTPLQDAKYDERCRQIALETLYIFSGIK